MDQQVEVILITAPADNPNVLTIGPIFQQFSRLEELHIVRSNIPAIGRHSFWGVPTLQKLNLTQNNISHVLDYNFRGLANLLELHLDDNRIESMPSGTFRYLHELRILSLARNRITELVPRLFLMLGKLHQLDLSGNRLMELNPEVFKDVQVGQTEKSLVIIKTVILQIVVNWAVTVYSCRWILTFRGNILPQSSDWIQSPLFLLFGRSDSILCSLPIFTLQISTLKTEVAYSS
jgi:Leucine-rich repeat (LRR) protein